MKTYKSNTHHRADRSISQLNGSKTPLFSNHGGLSSSIISKYTGNNRVTALNKSSIQMGVSRSPSTLRNPNENLQAPLYKRHAKQIPLRTKTPVITNEEPIEKKHSFTKFERADKGENSKRIVRDRKSIRTKGRDFHTKQETTKLTPKKSPNDLNMKSKPSKIMKSNDKMQSPFFNTGGDKSSKRVEIQQPKFDQGKEVDEEPRNMTIHQALSKHFMI
jgi:hypothetical protein